MKTNQALEFLKFSSLFIFSAMLLGCQQEDNVTTKPNVIFILADDLGYGDLSSYGHPYAKTPNIDKLAQNGLLMRRCYAPATFCSPSRAALMTGRHPSSFPGIPSKFGLSEFMTVTQLVKGVEYKTGHFGKWHIGNLFNNQTLPYGYDEIINVKPNSDANEVKDSLIFDSALKFMEKNKDNSFYVNIWPHSTHFPIRPLPTHQRHFRDLKIEKNRFDKWMNEEKFNKLDQASIDIDSSMKNYLAELSFLDSQVGRVLEWLKKNGLERNTIVVFTSDQGPAKIPNNIQSNSDGRADMLGYAGGLRGGKNDHYEGGLRIPFIIRWPEKIKSHRVDEVSIVSLLDWLPTIASILKVDVTPFKIDGIDLSEVLFENEEKESRELYWRKFGKEYPIAMVHDNWKMVINDGGDTQLFNLDDDLSELRNLSGKELDVLGLMETKLKKWSEENNHPKIKNPVIQLIYRIRGSGVQLTEVQLEAIWQAGADVGFYKGYNYIKESKRENRFKFRKLKKSVFDSILTKDQVLILEGPGRLN